MSFVSIFITTGHPVYSRLSPRAASGVAVHPDGSRVYVANQSSNTVSVINTATNTVIATVAVGINAFGVAVHPDGSRVYVANSGSNTVSVINTATNTVVGTVQVGSTPIAIGNFIGPAVPPPSPVLSVSPSSLDFTPPVTVGTSKDLSFTVQNTGVGTLAGSASTSASFSIVGDNSFSLTANQSALITVRFSPTSAGPTPLNSFVNFTSNGGNAALAVTGVGVLADTDGDGMPDVWEVANGLNPNDPSDAIRDADGDGISNLAEYVAGTNPQNRFTFGPLIPDAVLETPSQPVYGTCSVKSPQAGNLVVIIHGWRGWAIPKSNPPGAEDWVANMALKVQEVLRDRRAIADWDICAYDWETDAAGPVLLGAEAAWTKAGPQGQKLGNELFERGYDHIHFITHSAGSNLLQTAVDVIVGRYNSLHGGLTSSCNAIPIPNDCLLPNPTIHSTFLDAYIAESIFHPGRARKYATERYGAHAQWAEHYVATNVFGDDTDPILANAFNFDVTDLDPDSSSKFIPFKNHPWPHVWYDKTIDGTDPDGVSTLGFGFPMSLEDGIATLPSHDPRPGIQRYFPPGGECNLKTEATSCGQSVTSPPVPSLYTRLALDSFLNFSSAQASNGLLVSNSGTVTFPNNTTARAATGSPVWFSVSLNTATPKTALQFKYQLLSGVKGFLSVLFDGKLVYQLDQQFALPGANAALDIWLGDVLPGQHVLSFRLDAFDTRQAVIEISNVQTGLMQLVTNLLPTANAGPSQTVRLGSLVTLNGSASSDPDNGPGPLSYSWTGGSGPTVTLTGGTMAKPTFRPSIPGTYVFNLIVNDGLNGSAPASVRIIVPKLGDIDVDGDVDLIDLAKITLMVSKKASGPNDLRDLNGDGKIDLNDLKMFPKLCSRPLCLPEKH